MMTIGFSLVVLMTGDAGKNCKITGLRMAVGAGIPLAAVPSAIDWEILTIVIKG
jgi:hypothetical protein